MYGKTGYNRNVQLVLQHTMLQNEMKSDIARFNDHERNVATLYCWKTGSYVVGKTRDIAIYNNLSRFAAMLQNKLHVFCSQFTEL